MIIKSLSHEMLGKTTPGSGTLLDLGAFILEPNFDLGFVESEFPGEILTAFLREVFTVVEFFFESGELVGGEGCTRTLLLRVAVSTLYPARPGTCNNRNVVC